MTSSTGAAERDLVALRASRWQIVNDGVMGGRSDSTFCVEGGRGVFAGTLSPDNGGGFASVRGEVEAPPRDMIGVAVRLLGDGKRYQLRIHTEGQAGGLGYKHSFGTEAGQWIEARVALADFELSYRGRRVLDGPAVDPRQIRRIGFLISDEQWGAFRLEIDWIRALA